MEETSLNAKGHILQIMPIVPIILYPCYKIITAVSNQRKPQINLLNQWKSLLRFKWTLMVINQPHQAMQVRDHTRECKHTPTQVLPEDIANRVISILKMWQPWLTLYRSWSFETGRGHFTGQNFHRHQSGEMRDKEKAILQLPSSKAFHNQNH